LAIPAVPARPSGGPSHVTGSMGPRRAQARHSGCAAGRLRHRGDPRRQDCRQSKPTRLHFAACRRAWLFRQTLPPLLCLVKKLRTVLRMRSTSTLLVINYRRCSQPRPNIHFSATARLGTLPSLGGAGPDQVPLDIGQAAEHSNHQAAGRRLGGRHRRRRSSTAQRLRPPQARRVTARSHFVRVSVFWRTNLEVPP